MHAKLAKHVQQYKGRVVPQEDNVKDDDGYKAVFTVQGASASQVATAQPLDTISRRCGMSAVTQVHMSEAPSSLRSLEKKRPHVWIRPPPSRRPEQLNSIEEPVVRLERNLNGHLLAGLHGISILGEELGNCIYLGMSSRSSKITTVLEIKMGGKRLNFGLVQKNPRRDIDLEYRPLSRDQEFVGCTQAETRG